MNDLQKDIEESVLGGVFLHDTAWPQEVLEIEPEYFEMRQNAEIWMAVQDLLEKHEPVDEVAVHARMKALEIKCGFARLANLAADCPMSVNLGHWARLLVEAGRKKEADRALKEAAARVGAGGTADELAASVQDAMRAVKPRGEGGLMHIRHGLRSALAELKQKFEHPDASRVAATGLVDLDKMVEMSVGDLTIIAGRPSMGKSAIAGNIAAYCGKDPTRGAVAVFSLEMSTNNVICRMMSAESGVESSWLPAKAASGELVETANKIHGLNLFIDDSPNISILDVQKALTRIGNVRLVVFDYIQLANMGREDNQVIRIGRVTKGLKAVAKEFRCHVIGLCQLNRSVESRKPPIPQLADLRDSGNIEEDADNVLFLYRPNYYDPNEPDGVAQIGVAKQRNGPTGTVTVSWQKEIQVFRNLRR